MSLTRRTLLQQTSLALASLGLSQMGLSLLTRRYQRVLATPTPRKLALLVGINDYPESVCGLSSPKGTLLQGALTDMELYQELLVSRFGFHSSDIVTLSDQQATREGIETAFQFHLLEQAKEGDVVVFCFSGLGSSVQLSVPDAESVLSNEQQSQGVQNALVPVDGQLPTSDSPQSPQLNDLTQARLSRLLGALNTQNLISIVDAGFSYSQSVSSILRVRSRPTTPSGSVPELIPALQQRWGQKSDQQLGINTPSGKKSFKEPLSGIHVAASNSSGLVVETSWDGFSAGLFSYALTQRLWWTTPAVSLNVLLGQVSGNIRRVIDHPPQPLFEEGQNVAVDDAVSSRLLSTTAGIARNADGIILDVEANKKGDLRLWLAGLPAIVLEYCTTFSYMEVTGATVTSDASSLNPLLLQMRSHTGLTAKAKPYLPQSKVSSTTVLSTDQLTSGMFVYERVRVIPKDIGLIVSLDGLERIERVDATSALSTLSNITSAITGGKQPDCVFGKAQNSSAIKGATEQQGYGLLRLENSIIPRTIGPTEEAVKTAIHRVAPYFYGLLADKLLQLTVNPGSSQLGAQVSLKMVAPHQQLLSTQTTPRALWTSSTHHPEMLLEGNGNIPVLSVGHQVQCELQNNSDRLLYGLVLRIDSRGEMIVLQSVTIEPAVPVTIESDGILPTQLTAEDKVGSLASLSIATESTSAQSGNQSFQWTISAPEGLVTTYVILSCMPFTETISAFPQLTSSLSNSQTKIISDPIGFAQAVLQDLHCASNPSIEQLNIDISGERYGLEVGCWAAFTIMFDVVETPLFL